MALESWRKVLRGMFLVRRDDGTPFVTDRALAALAEALRVDDRRLIQGATSDPPPLQCVLDWPVDGACVVGYCAWQGDGLETVGEVEKFFADLCSATDRALKEPAAARFFLNPYDDWSRDEMRRNLGPEIALERDRRSMLRGCAGDVQVASVAQVGV